jgi:hypothetical protein
MALNLHSYSPFFNIDIEYAALGFHLSMTKEDKSFQGKGV